MICSVRSRYRAVKTGRRYLVTETGRACRRKTRYLPVRMSFTQPRNVGMFEVCGSGITTACTRHPSNAARWRGRSGARAVFNDGLRAREEAYAAGLPYISDAELSARLTAAKATPERAWLGGVSAVVLQQSLADLNTAYRNFFASVTGKRKGPKVELPRFKSRKDRRQAVRFTANARFRITPGGKLRLPKIGDIEVRWSRDLPSAPSSVTVIRDAAGGRRS